MARNRPRLGPEQQERNKVLGALPVVARFCERLDIRGTVDRAVPVRDVAILTHGQVIEALIANRLTSPQPLVHVEKWAHELDSTNRYAILYRIGAVKRAETRAKKIAGFIADLERGRTPHPRKP